MPRYFFDADNSTELIRDDTGIELAGEGEARETGMRLIGDLAKEHILSMRPDDKIGVSIRKADGQVMLQLVLSFDVEPQAKR